MKIEHTKNALDDVLKAVADVAGSDTAALVLNHLELSRYAAEKLMEHEVSERAGDRYSHNKPHAGRYRRWGSNVSARATTCCFLGLRAEVDAVWQQGVVSSWRCGVDS
jgi:hypothetical protein